MLERKPRWIRAYIEEYNEAVTWYNRAKEFLPPDNLQLVELEGYIGGMLMAAKMLNYRPKYIATNPTKGDEYREMDNLLPAWQKRGP